MSGFQTSSQTGKNHYRRPELAPTGGLTPFIKPSGADSGGQVHAGPSSMGRLVPWGVAVGPLFYTSYASSAGDRGPVQRFHFDVQNEIYGLLGRHPRHEGRLQRASPSSGLDRAVLACRALLVLYSADYLTDRQCALEWAVFRHRMERRQWLTGGPMDALVGVLWRTDSLVLPRAVADTAPPLEDAGEGYQGPGVSELPNDTGARPRYRALVRRVAERLTRAARTPLPVMGEYDSTSVQPSFGPGHEQHPRRPESSHPGSTENHLVLILLAGTRAAMEHLRESVDQYADVAEEWRPFRPYSEEPAADIACRTARAQGVDQLTVVTPYGAGLDALPETARSAIAVVLVDPWLTGDASFAVHWDQLARSGTCVSAVITVLPLQEQESRRAAGRLHEALARTPARRLGAAHHEAGSPEALSHAMAAALADAFTDAGGDVPSDRPNEPTAPRQHTRAGRARNRESRLPLATRTPRESWGGG